MTLPTKRSCSGFAPPLANVMNTDSVPEHLAGPAGPRILRDSACRSESLPLRGHTDLVAVANILDKLLSFLLAQAR